MNNFVNNWTYGEISPKLAGRFDLPIYHNGAETLLNYMPMKQGGVKRRPPLTHVAALTGPSRIISFTLSSGASFIVELLAGVLYVWGNVDGTFQKLSINVGGTDQDYVSTTYTATEIWELQYAQYYDRMYLVHGSHPLMELFLDASKFYFVERLLEVDVGSDFTKDADNYPSVIAVCQDRLWLAATGAQPFTVWASRPNASVKDTNNRSAGHYNFKTTDLAETTIEVIKDPEQWPTTTDEHGNEMYDLTDPDGYLETQTNTERVITAQCAMELELASGRNDKISWLGGLNNIIIGTESSEWMLPFNIDPTQQSASMQSSFGSQNVQAVILNNGIFYLQNGNRLREYTATAQGAGSYDHSFTADHILPGTVRQMISLRYPEPMIAMLRSDGVIVIFVYDQMYQIQSWGRWTTDGTFISIAVKEELGGKQELYAVVKRGDNYYLEKFNFDETLVFTDRYEEAQDGNLEYISDMVSNRLDFVAQDGNSIGRPKKIKEVWFRCLNTGKISTGISDDYMQESKEAVGSGDYRVLISGGSHRELRVRVRSVGGDPITLLAMSYEVEVN